MYLFVSSLSLVVLRLKKIFYLLATPKLWVCPSHPVFPSIEHLSVVRSAIASGVDCFYDVGANVGQFSLLLHSLGANTPILAFEPIPACFRRLNMLSTRMKRLACFNVAVGSSDTSLQFHLASSVDSSSFFRTTAAQESVYGVKSINKQILVRQLSLSSLLHSYPCSDGFLKIDVQGYELNVLSGCNNLSSYFKYIYVELSFVELYRGQPHFSEVANFLSRNGYRLVDIRNLFYSVSCLVQGDFLFERI